MSKFTEIFLRALNENGIERYSPFAYKFEHLAIMLRETNEKYNLTAITDDEGISYKHFADCLAALPGLDSGIKAADIGCGGGFPTLPFAIVRPDIEFTAIDSTAKKLAFIRSAADELGLKNVRTLCGRAEELGKGQARESFDVAFARAVARLNVLLEWCTPLVRVGGSFYALKGKDGGTELDESTRALGTLNCTAVLRDYTLFTPVGQSRALISVKKQAPTPQKYPRTGGVIKKKPL